MAVSAAVCAAALLGVRVRALDELTVPVLTGNASPS